MKKIIITLLLLTSFATISFSQTQTEMNQATSAEYKKADKELNLVYGQLVKKMDATQKAGLIEVEKAWIKYRDLQCKFAAQKYEGGSIYSSIFDSAMTTMTKQRVEELKLLLEDYSR